VTWDILRISMRKRWRLWFCLSVLVLLLGFFWVYFHLSSDRITLENFRKIDSGMTENEVEKILGRPGRTFYTVEVENPANEFVRRLVLKKWIGVNGNEITIEFDIRNSVWSKGYAPASEQAFLIRSLGFLETERPLNRISSEPGIYQCASSSPAAPG